VILGEKTVVREQLDTWGIRCSRELRLSLRKYGRIQDIGVSTSFLCLRINASRKFLRQSGEPGWERERWDVLRLPEFLDELGVNWE